MMVIVNKEDKTIFQVSESAEIVNNGILLDSFIIGIPVGEDGEFVEMPYEVHDMVKIPDNFAPEKYKFIDGELVINDAYEIKYASPELKRIAELEQETIELQYQLLTGEVM